MYIRSEVFSLVIIMLITLKYFYCLEVMGEKNKLGQLEGLGKTFDTGSDKRVG
jgi:hypothetical protein